MARSKFENKKTFVSGLLVNTETAEATKFENVEISYARSTSTAIKNVRDVLQLNDAIVIAITELKNEKAKPIRYNSSKIYEYALSYHINEDDAKDCLIDKHSIRKVEIYDYESAFWAIDENGEYITDFVHDESLLNMTKQDMRHFLINSAQQIIGANYTVIGIHGEKKEARAVWCIIADNELEKCIIKSNE